MHHENEQSGINYHAELQSYLQPMSLCWRPHDRQSIKYDIMRNARANGVIGNVNDLAWRELSDAFGDGPMRQYIIPKAVAIPAIEYADHEQLLGEGLSSDRDISLREFEQHELGPVMPEGSRMPIHLRGANEGVLYPIAVFADYMKLPIYDFMTMLAKDGSAFLRARDFIVRVNLRGFNVMSIDDVRAIAPENQTRFEEILHELDQLDLQSPPVVE